jgi:taurine---2-oxoglutarate transaminase
MNIATNSNDIPISHSNTDYHVVDVINDNLQYTLFSWSKQRLADPLVIKKAEGVYFYDQHGRRYLDFSSQLINVNIGHGHPKVAEAVARQMSSVSYIHPGMITEVRGELGKKLSDISPGGPKKTFFTLGGADAIENAIKLARASTGRHKIISFYQSYHGGSYGALSASGDPRRFSMDSQAMPNVVRVENPYAYRCPWQCEGINSCTQKCVDHVERIIQLENPESIAAIIFEGESGSSGCIKYPGGYLQKIESVARKFGILLIDDEVMSGFGRTGKWFAVEHHNVKPDIICVAKGLTSGYLPLGAVIVDKRIAEQFDYKTLPLGLTYSAHPVALAAALAVLEIYEDENLIDNAAQMGKYIEQGIDELKKKHMSIGDFRNTGLFGCIELVKNRAKKTPLVPWNAKAEDNEPVNRIASKLIELGLSTIVRWNFIFIAPPLTINKSQIDDAMSILSEVLVIADSYYER